MNSPIVVSEEQQRAIENLDPLRKVQLTCTIYRDPQGQPLKTELAKRFPLLPRRERRAMARSVAKNLKNNTQ
jgi:hypothetical protein